jgi:probable rRNA maturation factor
VNKTIRVRNRQRAQPVNSRLLEKITRHLLVELLQADSIDLGIYIIAAREMTRLNESFLSHQGSTDVLAFDYTEVPGRKALCGEIFICVDEAKIQAGRFQTTWQSELVRYLVHGVLHLRGYDDNRPTSRRKMKREENRLLKALDDVYTFSALNRNK